MDQITFDAILDPYRIEDRILSPDDVEPDRWYMVCDVIESSHAPRDVRLISDRSYRGIGLAHRASLFLSDPKHGDRVICPAKYADLHVI